MYQRCLTKLLLTLFLYCSVWASPINAQSEQYGLRVFDMRDGLPQMKINDVAIDAKGNLWLATRGGLSKFDGEKFTNYTTKDGLLSDRVHSVIVTSNQRIALLTTNGLSLFDGAEFQHFTHPFLEVTYNMMVRPDSSIWIVGFQEIWEWKQDSLSLLDQFNPLSDKGFVYDPAMNTICRGTYECFVNGQWKQIRDLKAKNFLGDIRHIDDHILFSKWRNDRKESIGHYEQGTFVEDMLFNPKTKEIKLWDNAGIYVYSDGRLRYNTRRGDHIDLKYNFNFIHKVIETTSGHLVIASDVGLGIIPPKYFKQIDDPALPNIWTIGEGPGQNIYAFSYQQGAFRMRPKDFQIHKINNEVVKGKEFFWEVPLMRKAICTSQIRRGIPKLQKRASNMFLQKKSILP